MLQRTEPEVPDRARTTILALSVLTLALGFAVQVVIAAKLGTGRMMDVYLMAITLPTIFAVLSITVIPLALVPVLREHLAPQHSESLTRLFGGIGAAIGLVAMALVVALILGADLVVRVLAPGFDPEAVRATATLLRIMLLGSVFDALRGVQMAAFYARERFFLPQLAPSLNHLVVLASALLLLDPMGLPGIAVGWAAGSALMFATMVPGIYRAGLIDASGFGVRRDALRSLRLFLPVLLATLLFQATPLFDRLIASTLPTGAISFLGYGSKMLEIMMRTAPMAITLAAFPRLSGLAADLSWEEFRATLVSGLRQIMLCSVPLAVLVVLVREPLIRALFQRGAFDESATAGVALAVGWYAIAFTPAAGAHFLSHALYATKNAWTLVRVWSVAVIVNVALDLVLAKFLGYSGIAVAFVAVSTLLFFSLTGALHKRHHGIDWGSILKAVGQTVVAALPAAAVVVVLRSTLLRPGLSEIRLLAGLAGIGALCIATYALTLLVLGNAEVRDLLRRLNRRPKD